MESVVKVVCNGQKHSGGCKGRARGVARRYADRDLGGGIVVTKRDSERTGCLNS